MPKPNLWPERFEKSYFHWVDNLHDWCISRQIWFGHRIPVWYKGDEVYFSTEAPTGDGWDQDPDVLDTWFSSALWTFSTLGWPEETDDLKAFHPTTFMSPSYEILFLWISRMVLMAGFHLGQIPFKEAMIHGMVRDKQGRKFSKSLGNGIDPLDIIEKYGADALRMGLMIGAAPGNDVKFDESKIKGYKHFSNKLWNVTRFVLSNTVDVTLATTQTLTKGDAKLVKELDALTKDVTQYISVRRLDLAADMLYHYIWHELADVILEDSKKIFEGGSDKAKISRRWTLYHILITNLKLLHPFMPFVTETIWQRLPKKMRESDMLMVASWPTSG